MAKKQRGYFICLNVVFLTLFACNGTATLFHGPQPEEQVPVFTIAFDANEATGIAPSAQTVNRRALITMPDEGGLSKGANVFTGWNISKSGGGTTWPPESSYTVTADQTFYAQWADPAQVYTVTYDANGASGAPPSPRKAVQNGDIIVADKENLTNAGKTFAGWNTAAAGTGTNYNAGDTLTVSADITLYAQWIDPSIQWYTITYHANGASGSPPSARMVNEGASITLPSAGSLSYSNRTFAGWNTAANGSGTSYAAGDGFTVNANTAFYAQWTDDPGLYVNGTLQKEDIALAESLDWISANAVSGYTYGIVLGVNTSIMPVTLSYTGKTNVTVVIKGDSTERTLSLNQNGRLFTIGSGVTLVLEKNLKLLGRNANTYELIRVNSSGKFIMNGGEISGNTGSYNGYASAVDNRGAFIMNGGKITECSDNSRGTVCSYGTFTMNGGEINNNVGRGVYVYPSSTGSFQMTGGKITNNFASKGGGIYISTYSVSKTITISGGEISNNTASRGGGIYGGGYYGGQYSVTLNISGGVIKNNAAASGNGGGIYANGTVNMTGGVISGNNAQISGGGIYARTFKKSASGGVVYGSDAADITLQNKSGNGEGHAVYISGSPAKKRNVTVDTGTALDSANLSGWE
jgi:hypothetical protein